MTTQQSTNHKPKILIISGEPGSGKTSLCMASAAWCRSHGIAQTGITSPGLYVASTRIAIQAYNIQDTTMRLLGIRKDIEVEELRSHIDVLKQNLPLPYIETERWCFSEHIFNECNTLLYTNHESLFWVDELGILEFEYQKGYVKAFEALRSQMYKLAIVVIGPGLVPYFSQYVPDIAYEVINISEHPLEQLEFMQILLNHMRTCGIQA